ncbi:MAG TPA: DNA polymerase III subunit delta [Actinomycetales bacterium]|nr:DNA polymerase III subunit delta [Actinomycetales bacterium]
MSPSSPDLTAPLHLVAGPEQLLAERAVAEVVAAARAADSSTQVVHVPSEGYTRGDLTVHTSPSLFGERKVVVLTTVEDAGDDLVTDAKAAVAAPEPDVVLVLRHSGGSRGKGLLDAAKKAGAQLHDCAAVKSDKDKATFVVHEFRRRRRAVTEEAVQALVDALGQDLRELASACQQLVDDTTPPDAKPRDLPPVDAAVVEQYYGGRVEVTGFKVADAAIAGQTGEALALLRHALASGLDPVPLVAVLGTGLRSLAKVSAVGGARSAEVARELSMAPWQVDKARRQLRGWTPDGLAAAIEAVAAADLAVKGGLPVPGRRAEDPVYAVERAVLTIGSARRAR